MNRYCGGPGLAGQSPNYRGMKIVTGGTAHQIKKPAFDYAGFHLPVVGGDKLALQARLLIGADREVHALDRRARRTLAEVIESSDGDEALFVAEHE